MDLKLKEQGSYGSPTPEIRGKCEICGQPINLRLKRCLTCAEQNFISPKEHPSQSRKLGCWLVLLLITLIVLGIYLILVRKTDGGASGAQGFATSKSGADERLGTGSLTTPIPPSHATSVAPPAAGAVTAPASVNATQKTLPSAIPSTGTTIAPATIPNLTVTTIVCPACTGQGRLAYDPPRKGTYTCPVCAGRGNRVRRYLANNWKLCATCKGMGTLAKPGDLFRTKNVIVKETCPTCAGRGLTPIQDK